MNRSVKSTCCYCGVGCGVLIETEDGVITGVRGDPEHPANRRHQVLPAHVLQEVAGSARPERLDEIVASAWNVGRSMYCVMKCVEPSA